MSFLLQSRELACRDDGLRYKIFPSIFIYIPNSILILNEFDPAIKITPKV